MIGTSGPSGANRIKAHVTSAEGMQSWSAEGHSISLSCALTSAEQVPRAVVQISRGVFMQQAQVLIHLDQSTGTSPLHTHVCTEPETDLSPVSKTLSLSR